MLEIRTLLLTLVLQVLCLLSHLPRCSDLLSSAPHHMHLHASTPQFFQVHNGSLNLVAVIQHVQGFSNRILEAERLTKDKDSLWLMILKVCVGGGGHVG